MSVETRPAISTLPKENLGIVKEPIARDIHVNFLDDAFREGANLRLPKGVTQDYWIRDQIIAAEYYRNGRLMPDLGVQHGLTRSMIQQVLRKTLTRLWRNSSPSLQEKYPLEKLVVTRKFRESKKEEQPVPKVDIYEIAKKAGVGISDTRKVLEALRQNVEFTLKHFSLRDIVKRLKEENDDKRTQELLDEIPSMSLINYMSEMKLKSESNVFIFLGVIFKENRIHVPFAKFHIVGEFLRSMNIPIKRAERGGKRPQNYWIVLTRDVEKVIRAVKENPEFQKFVDNPVKIVYGGSTQFSSIPSINEPRTDQRDEKGECTKVAGFLRIRFGLGPAIYRRYSELLADSPVQIYRARSVPGLFFRKEDEETLALFLKGKLTKLGIKIKNNHKSHIDNGGK